MVVGLTAWPASVILWQKTVAQKLVKFHRHAARTRSSRSKSPRRYDVLWDLDSN